MPETAGHGKSNQQSGKPWKTTGDYGKPQESTGDPGKPRLPTKATRHGTDFGACHTNSKLEEIYKTRTCTNCFKQLKAHLDLTFAFDFGFDFGFGINFGFNFYLGFVLDFVLAFALILAFTLGLVSN